MTKVAPCVACAGPNTAPRNEWAIMMWSRTSTANKKASLRIRNELTDNAVPGVKNLGEPARQVAKPYFRSEKCIEARVGKQSNRCREPAVVRPARSMRHGDSADLTRNQPQTAAVESTAERNCHRCVAIPAEFEHRRFVAGKRKSSTKSGRAAASVKDHIAVVSGGFRLCKAHCKLLREFGALFVDVDERCFDADETAADERNKRTDGASTDNCNPVCGPDRRIPYRVEGRLHISGQHRPSRRHCLRQRHNSTFGNVEVVLVRVQRKNSTAEVFLRAFLDLPHGRVSVFYRKRKPTTHKRRAHALELALWHPAGKDQSLSPTAQRAE